MSKIDRYRYNPSLSVAENASINGVDEDSMRYYIKSMGIDRRYEAKVSIVEDIRKYLTGHPNATKAEDCANSTISTPHIRAVSATS